MTATGIATSRRGLIIGRPNQTGVNGDCRGPPVSPRKTGAARTARARCPTEPARVARYVRYATPAELNLAPVDLGASRGRRRRSALAAAAWVVAGILPLAGLGSPLPPRPPAPHS